MKIVLIEARAPSEHIYSRTPFPRIGVPLLATILRDRGHQVSAYVEDVAPVDVEDVRTADLVGISTLTNTAPRAYELAKLARGLGTPVVLGGIHPTFAADEALEHAEYVVRGEAEHSLPEFVEALETSGDLSRIAGLSYRDGDRRQHNPPRPLTEDIEALPIPDLGLVRGLPDRGTVSVMSTRGCPFHCSFCAVPSFCGHELRSRSVDQVLAEIEQHMRRFRVEYLFFADDIFNLKRDRALAILRGMIENRWTPMWGAQVRHEIRKDHELMEAMARARCDRLYIGFESVNPDTLKLYGKKETVENIEETVRVLHRYGIKVHGMFVLGSDEDTVETVRETQRLATRWDIDSVQFLSLTPIPGSKDFEPYRKGERRFVCNDWGSFDGMHVIHQPPRMTPYELQVELIRAMKKFYSWPGILRRAARLDIYETKIRVAAKVIISKWVRNNRAYVSRLREELSTAIQPVLLRPRRQVKTAAVISDGCERSEATSTLERFVAALGLKVPNIGETLDDLVHKFLSLPEDPDLRRAAVRAQLLSWRQKSDCVILSLTEAYRQRHAEALRQIRQIVRTMREESKKLPEVLVVAAEDLLEPFLPTATRLGLFFTGNLDRIRAACEAALAPA